MAREVEGRVTAPQTNPALADFWEQVFIGEADIAVLHGGRSSSKTRDTACQLVRLVDHVGVKMRVLCIRRFQNRIQESVYTELKWAIAHLGLRAAFDVQKTTIIHRATGSEFIFYGIERNLEDIKGTSDVDILWVEEAEKLTEDQWTVIGPTIRKEDSLAILLFNPKYVTDYVWKHFVVNTPPHTVVRKIDWTDNPFLSQKALRDIAAMQESNPELFEHVYGGVPLGDSELSIFKRRWLEACVDAHKVLKLDLTGRNIVGFDPGYLEFTGPGLDAQHKAIQNSLDRAVIFGANLLADTQRTAESGEAIKLRLGNQTSTLKTIALTSAEGLERALRNLAKWMGEDPESVIVTPNTDFFDHTLSPQEITAVVAGWQAGAYSKQTMFDRFKKGELVPADRTFEEEQDMIGTEQPTGLIPPAGGAANDGQ